MIEQEQTELRPGIDVLKASSVTAVPAPKEDWPATVDVASWPHWEGGSAVVIALLRPCQW